MEDRRARFERLYGAHSPDVALYALRRADRETAQDVVSETFTVAWRRLDEIPDEPLPWLYGVARRVLANQRRSATRLAALRRRLEPAQSPPTEVSDVTLANALLRLDETDRELLMLVAWEGLSPSEAAAALGCSDSACRVRLHRARRRLAAALDLEASPAQQLAEEVS